MTRHTPQIVPNLIWRVLNDEVVVVSPQIGEYCVLNEVGTFIWQLLAADKSEAEIENNLISRYEVDLAQARHDLQDFLADLRAKGLVVSPD